jgi:hypothetical protein
MNLLSVRLLSTLLRSYDLFETLEMACYRLTIISPSAEGGSFLVLMGSSRSEEVFLETRKDPVRFIIPEIAKTKFEAFITFAEIC